MGNNVLVCLFVFVKKSLIFIIDILLKIIAY